MRLQAGLGVSLMFMHGGKDEARVALERSFAIAEQIGSELDQLEVLGPLQMFHLRKGEFRTALRYAERCSRLAVALNDQTSATLAYALMGISLHLSGELKCARTALEAALLSSPHPKNTTANYLGFDGRILAGAILARTLWLQGLQGEAIERSMATVEEAKTLNHPLTYCIALVWAVSVFLWADDVDRAETYIEELLRTAERHSLRPYSVVGRGFQHDLDIRKGDVFAGIEGLRNCVRELRATPYELLNTQLILALLEGLLAAKETEGALELCDETINAVEANGDLCYLPELMHVRARIVLVEPHGDDRQATAIPMRSAEPSKRIPHRFPETSLSIGVGRRSALVGTAVDAASLL
jgi:tetratricopeptide (TPR) repeat protein